MRITKNDVWDARLDTSNDSELPTVDLATGEITNPRNRLPSLKEHKYPQPRCAAELRLGRIGPGGVQWYCIRDAAQHVLTPDEDGLGANMEVGGKANDSTGYETSVPGSPRASSLHMTLKGSKNASYYVAVIDDAGTTIYRSGWKQSPVAEEDISATFTPGPVGRLALYTMTRDGKVAKNHIRNVTLHTDGDTPSLGFPKPSATNARLDLRRAVAAIPSAQGGIRVRVLEDRNVVLVNSAHPVVIEPVKAATLPDPTLGTSDGIDWLMMNMPGDLDYEGMDYAVAVASRGALKAVALVTSFDIQSRDVLPAAIALARESVMQAESALIAAHERGWERFWSRSGVELEDKAMQGWWYRILYFANTVCKPGAAPCGTDAAAGDRQHTVALRIFITTTMRGRHSGPSPEPTIPSSPIRGSPIITI